MHESWEGVEFLLVKFENLTLYRGAFQPLFFNNDFFNSTIGASRCVASRTRGNADFHTAIQAGAAAPDKNRSSFFGLRKYLSAFSEN